MTASTIHASAVLYGHRGLLIRGPSGSGKSRLALSLLQGATFARLVGDDRIHLEAVHGRLLMRPAPALQGLLEIRGLGIRRLPFEPVAVAHLVVDLAAGDAQRLLEPEAMHTVIEAVPLARLPVAPGADALTALIAFLQYGEPQA
jgi:serine kinase of HPr protein (carbohydrate metabolism regulator)